MKTKKIYFTILALFLAIIIGFRFRREPSPPLRPEQIENLFGNAMPANLMTPQPHADTDFNELIRLIETTMGDEWGAIGGPKHHVRTNDLIEVDGSDSAYVLSMQLFWQDQHLATEARYFVSYSGPDGEIEDRPLTFLGCGMFSKGFLTGSCKLAEMSSISVSVEPDWTFDNRDSNVESRFDQSFTATVGNAGITDCENGAMIKWEFATKAPEPSDEHEVAESVQLTKQSTPATPLTRSLSD